MYHASHPAATVCTVNVIRDLAPGEFMVLLCLGVHSAYPLMESTALHVDRLGHACE